MERIGPVTRECFNALAQLRGMEDVYGVRPEMVYDRLREFIDRMRAEGRQAGISDKDMEDVAYAIVALADEVAFSKPDPLRGFWMRKPLQLALFNENLAGEGFFDRLDSLRDNPRRLEVLKVYYMCLLLGFQGRYMGDNAAGLVRLTEEVGREIARAEPVPSALSPNAEPPDEPMRRKNDRNPWIWAAAGLLVLSAGVLVVLRIMVDGDFSEAVRNISRIAESAS